MIKIVLCLSIFSFFCSTLVAQEEPREIQAEKLMSKADELLYKENPTTFGDSLALDYYEKAKGIYREIDVNHPKLFDIYLNIGSIKQFNGRIDEALIEYKKSLSLKQVQMETLDSSIYDVVRYLGLIFWEKNNFDSALYFTGIAEKLIERYPQLPYKFKVYNDLGAINYFIGSYKQSINYYEKALSFLSTEDNGKVFSIYFKNNFATSLRKLGKHDQSILIYNELLNYRSDLKELYVSIGKTYYEKKDYHKAIEFLSLAQKVEKNRVAAISKDDIGLLIALGESLFALDNIDAARESFIKAIKLNNSQYQSKNVDLFLSYTGLANIALKEQNFGEALSYYQSSILALAYNFESKNIYTNPSSSSQFVSPIYFFDALKHKGAAFYKYYNQTQKLKDLQASLSTYQLAIQVADNIRKSFDSDEAKLFFTQTAYPIYEEAINVAFTAYQKTQKHQYLEMAFNFMEKSKAAVLSESLRDLEIKRLPGIPEEVLQKEKELKRKITSLTIKTIEGKDSTQLVGYKNQIRDYEIELAKVHKELQQNPVYHQLKYATINFSLKDVQEKIVDNRKVLLEYFLGEKNIFIFQISADHIHLRKVLVTKELSANLDKLNTSFYNGTFHEAKSEASYFYQKLIAPFAREFTGKKELVIVPDGLLNYIPFEALITDKNSSFLIKDYVISYAYSSSLLHNALKASQAKAQNSILAMAPFAGHSFNTLRAGVIAQLPSSKKEVEQVGGRIYLESKATKELFLKESRKYGIIHLATHAKADSEDPLNSFITFYPKNADSLSGYRLYTNELYNLNLDSVRLVVLSACETGGGKYTKGEGVMSLARAFAYAGCPNIVMSLWKADDKATADIISQMHHYLKKGDKKDEALRKAKLDYLESNSGSKLNEPYYWANFVFIGNNEPLYPNYTLWWILGGCILFLIVIVLVAGKKRSVGF